MIFLKFLNSLKEKDAQILFVVSVVVSCFVYCLVFIVRSVVMRRRMPPGPRGLLWIGNTHQIPPVKPWRTFEQLNKQYGPVISLFFGRTSVIVLGTAQAAWDLLEKRSEIYSSRPRFVMAGEILSDNMRGLLLPNNERWRRWRKVLHLGFNSRQAAKYKEIQSLESKIAMYQILTDPANYERHLQRYAASVVTSVTYGMRIESMDEWIIKENRKSTDYLTSVNIPGKYIVESCPWLLRLPRSLQWFRREAEEGRQLEINLFMHILNDIKRRMAAGAIPDCLAVQTVENHEKIGMSELEVAYAIESPFGAGIETTAGTLATFILAMIHFPEVMANAQAELDKVVGTDRTPEYDDLDNLPYIRALVSETLRWRPVAVLGGTPHAVTADDIYNGMLIPKGSTIYANLAGIMNDPVMFPEPETFRPERFLETTDPRLHNFDLPFGFGRRICPGMHLARNSIFINVARILWSFNILPELDAQGKPIIPDSMAYTDGFNSRPISFACRFVPRGRKYADIVKGEAAAAESRLKGSNW